MTVTVSKFAGFCPGVRRATQHIESILSDHAYDEVHILGELIHNQIYLDSIYRRGVRSVTFSEIENIVRAMFR